MLTCHSQLLHSLTQLSIPYTFPGDEEGTGQARSLPQVPRKVLTGVQGLREPRRESEPTEQGPGAGELSRVRREGVEGSCKRLSGSQSATLGMDVPGEGERAKWWHLGNSWQCRNRKWGWERLRCQGRWGARQFVPSGHKELGWV